jgi:hypothetical protein
MWRETQMKLVKCIVGNDDAAVFPYIDYLVVGNVYRVINEYANSYDIEHPTHRAWYKWHFIELPDGVCEQCGEKHQ